jgi:hypothetical protein
LSVPLVLHTALVPAGITPLRTYFMKSFLDAMPCMWIWQKNCKREWIMVLLSE